ncbi:hypothetical protein TanjilG_19750 [Lupinus angustifolius]|uniref:ABC-2 type transporter transmembrane domain-containing protein n=1 Tax=Lupinus angustifolius TaxID=3871 RepID=A0A394CYY4_LUPAN|nr:hypothetical protein TanjilG_00059 [Lupinus angustifolius]OIW20685.1 hypothetical protein TanjilG_19750 [Lupinus angustifolius]
MTEMAKIERERENNNNNINELNEEAQMEKLPNPLPYRSNSGNLTTIIGAMYGSLFFVGVNNCQTVQPVVAIERTVFYRERAAGMYSALPYAIAQVIIEIPYCFVQTMLFSFIVYAMVSFEWQVAKVFWFLFVSFFTFLYFTYYGMMTVSITPNHQVASIFGAAFYGLFNLFSGFFIARPFLVDILHNVHQTLHIFTLVEEKFIYDLPNRFVKCIKPEENVKLR